MKIAIAGGTGFVGGALVQALRSEDHDLYILTRHPEKFNSTARLKYVRWLHPEDHPEKDLSGLDVFINLAGESLNSGRWTKERKRRIVESRLEAVKEMNRILSANGRKAEAVINASAIGYYGTSETESFTEENESVAADFLARTVQLWEKEALKARAFSKRVVLTRFGLILGSREGALPLMALPYRLFAGGTIGTGRQWLSWIHINDAVRAIAFCMNNQPVSGPVNVTAPYPARMAEFGRTIGHVLHRPHWFPVPAIMMKTSLGEMSMLITDGQKVLPNKLTGGGFTFEYPRLEHALQNLLNKDV